MNHSRKLLKRIIAITTAASFVTVGGRYRIGSRLLSGGRDSGV